MARELWWAVLAAGLLAACDGDAGGGGDGPGDGAPPASDAAPPAPDAGADTGTDAAADGALPAADGGADAAVPADRLLPQDCDPMGGRCGLPWPSDVYLEADPTGKNPSGKSVRFRPETLPKSFGRRPIPLELFHDLDGFSPGTAAMTFMPGATVAGLATPATIPTTVTPDSPTVILNTRTGELVPHWADLDESARNADQKALMLRPAKLLDTATRYIVAIRRVQDADGAELPPTDVFRALRDGTDHADPSVASRRAHYDDVFAKLTAAGVDRASLQIAWDFTTGTRDSITGPMLKVRDAALAVVGADGPEYTVTSVEHDPNEHIKTRILANVRFPLYLNTAAYELNDPVPYMLWDEQGQPMQNGFMEAEVLIQIPKVVDEPGRRLGVIQNGHGLFGGKEEGRNGYLAKIASYGYVTISMDLYGFAEADVVLAVQALSGVPEMLQAFVDRQIQGQVNQLLGMRMMIGRIARDGIRDAEGNVLLEGGVIDPALRAYRGDSQGGIMGATYMAVSTDVTRGLLGETGAPYSLLLNRSTDWPMYGAILAGTYTNDLDVQLMLALVQTKWDRSEPSGFAPFVKRDPLPGTPAHDALIHVAIGDHQVSTFGAHVLARSLGAKALRSNDPARPFPREIWGLEAADGPLQGESAIVEYLFDLPAEPLTNLPQAQGCDPHDRVRILGPSYEQQDHFFRTGEIRWACDGICDCDLGPGAEVGCPESFEDQCR